MSQNIPTAAEWWAQGHEQQKSSAGLALGALTVFGLGKLLTEDNFLEYAAIVPAVLALIVFYSGGTKKMESMD